MHWGDLNCRVDVLLLFSIFGLFDVTVVTPRDPSSWLNSRRQAARRLSNKTSVILMQRCYTSIFIGTVYFDPHLGLFIDLLRIRCGHKDAWYMRQSITQSHGPNKNHTLDIACGVLRSLQILPVPIFAEPSKTRKMLVFCFCFPNISISLSLYMQTQKYPCICWF